MLSCGPGWRPCLLPQFGRAAAAAGLQYIEEPVRSVHDLAEFHRLTGVPVALDETVDKGKSLSQCCHELAPSRLCVLGWASRAGKAKKYLLYRALACCAHSYALLLT
jgi:L-alanine-DL-glutamate epimerase-like enolase superfamily enzyme